MRGWYWSELSASVSLSLSLSVCLCVCVWDGYIWVVSRLINLRANCWHRRTVIIHCNCRYATPDDSHQTRGRGAIIAVTHLRIVDTRILHRRLFSNIVAIKHATCRLCIVSLSRSCAPPTCVAPLAVLLIILTPSLPTPCVGVGTPTLFHPICLLAWLNKQETCRESARWRSVLSRNALLPRSHQRHADRCLCASWSLSH